MKPTRRRRRPKKGWGSEMADMEIKIDKDLVRSVLDAKIQAAIASELLGAKETIAAIAEHVMKIRVNDKGEYTKPGDYRYDRCHPLIEGLTRQAIRAAIKKAVYAWVEDQQPQIRAAVEAELKRKSSGFAKAMVDGFSKCLKDDWRMSINCQFKSHNED